MDTQEVKPLCIDLFCGLGGWSEGFLAEGYDCVGFDIERHRYAMPDIQEGNGGKGTRPVEKRGWTQGCAISLGMEGSNNQPRTRLAEYPAQLVLQDILTVHGKQFRNAAVIVASPPCQEYSYMAMPWTRAKNIAAEYRSGKRDVVKLNALFNACFRIQLEACEAAGRYIPMVVENVVGAQRWVGPAKWHYGSFYLWGDVPALMPTSFKVKVSGLNWSGSDKPGYVAKAFNTTAEQGLKTVGHANMRDGRYAEEVKELGYHKLSPGWRAKQYENTDKMRLTNQRESDGVKHGGDCFSDPRWPGRQGGVKQHGSGEAWFDGEIQKSSSRSNARKAASAAIAKIPLALSRHIARVYKPVDYDMI